MLTLELLREFGADVDEGLGRCMNNEQFYLRLVSKVVDDASFEKLESAVNSGDKDAAFEAAHSLKGVLGNLAITPIFSPVSEMTELLRAKKDADYKSYLETVLSLRDQLREMCSEPSVI